MRSGIGVNEGQSPDCAPGCIVGHCPGSHGGCHPDRAVFSGWCPGIPSRIGTCHRPVRLSSLVFVTFRGSLAGTGCPDTGLDLVAVDDDLRVRGDQIMADRPHGGAVAGQPDHAIHCRRSGRNRPGLLPR